MGNAMLAIVKMIDSTFSETTIWGLTSLYRLVLLTQDDWKSCWYITIIALNENEIAFEYLIPTEKKSCA